jgi:hypothetical protein
MSHASFCLHAFKKMSATFRDLDHGPALNIKIVDNRALETVIVIFGSSEAHDDLLAIAHAINGAGNNPTKIGRH